MRVASVSNRAAPIKKSQLPGQAGETKQGPSAKTGHRRRRRSAHRAQLRRLQLLHELPPVLLLLPRGRLLRRRRARLHLARVLGAARLALARLGLALGPALRLARLLLLPRGLRRGRGLGTAADLGPSRE